MKNIPRAKVPVRDGHSQGVSKRYSDSPTVLIKIHFFALAIHPTKSIEVKLGGEPRYGVHDSRRREKAQQDRRLLDGLLRPRIRCDVVRKGASGREKNLP